MNADELARQREFHDECSYWFFMRNESGQSCQFRYPTYREAYAASLRNNIDGVWFMDRHGEHHRTEPIRGQERFL